MDEIFMKFDGVNDVEIDIFNSFLILIDMGVLKYEKLYVYIVDFIGFFVVIVCNVFYYFVDVNVVGF